MSERSLKTDNKIYRRAKANSMELTQCPFLHGFFFVLPTDSLDASTVHRAPLHSSCTSSARNLPKNVRRIRRRKWEEKKWQCFDNIFIQVTIRMHFRQFFWQTTCEYTYIYISYTLTHLYSRSISACTSQAKIFPNIDRCTPGTTTVCVCVCEERIKYHLKIFYLKSNNELLAKINK